MQQEFAIFMKIVLVWEFSSLKICDTFFCIFFPDQSLDAMLK